MNNQGWIKIHRKILSWEWYLDINTSRLFIHLLLVANHEKARWQGIDILPGQCVTGRMSLSKQTGLSEQQTRSALNKLKSTNEITIKTTNKYSVITILNWKVYQQDNQQTNQQITNNQPTNNQQITTNKNEKNDNNKKNEKKYISKPEVLEKDLLEIIDCYNEVFNKRVTSYLGFIENYKKWKEVHNTEKIKRAIYSARTDKFWKDKMTLTILFRLKNSRGENVDYIEDLSSREQTSSIGKVGII
jgi:hypothetical protein